MYDLKGFICLPGEDLHVFGGPPFGTTAHAETVADSGF